MNRIFKVIWSKTKHCYIVVSEYAKANTKAAHTGLRTTAAAAAVAAMLLAPVNYNYAWAADPTVTVTDTNKTQQTVYTTDGADNTFVKKGSDKTSTALHISSSGDLIVGTKENQTVKDMEIRGKLTSGSISTGGITSTGDVTVTQTSHTENIPYALINQLELNVESHSRTLLCTQTTHPKSGQIVQESFQERFDQQDF